MFQQERVLAALTEDLGSQATRHSSPPFVTPDPGDLIPSSGFCRYQVCMWYTDKNADKTLIHIKEK